MPNLFRRTDYSAQECFNSIFLHFTGKLKIFLNLVVCNTEIATSDKYNENKTGLGRIQIGNTLFQYFTHILQKLYASFYRSDINLLLFYFAHLVTRLE
jgi:hypothetical protein